MSLADQSRMVEPPILCNFGGVIVPPAMCLWIVKRVTPSFFAASVVESSLTIQACITVEQSAQGLSREKWSKVDTGLYQTRNASFRG
jgi:hypothetical protein